MIQSERSQNAAEMTAIHKQLLDQRDFCERDLTARLAVAHKFVEDFSDLHMDRFTQQLADETSGYREELRKDNAYTLEMLNENESHRTRLHKLEQQNQIYQMGVDKAETQHSKLKSQADSLEFALHEQLTESEQKLNDMHENIELKIEELRTRLTFLRNQNVDLKQEVAIATRNLAIAQEAKYEHFKKEYELMQSMNKAAAFLLTALDEKYGPTPEENDIRNKRSTLNQIIRKLAMIKHEKREPKVVKVDRADVEVQTDRIKPRIKAPPFSANGANPRRRGTVQRFKDIPEYKIIFGSIPLPSTVRENTKVRAQKIKLI
jgi:chromosome segregation ATPase